MRLCCSKKDEADPLQSRAENGTDEICDRKSGSEITERSPRQKWLFPEAKEMRATLRV